VLESEVVLAHVRNW